MADITQILFTRQNGYFTNRDSWKMCKKYEDEAGMWKKTGEVVEVTFDTLRESGLTGADERKVFRLCSEKIREEDPEKMHFFPLSDI